MKRILKFYVNLVALGIIIWLGTFFSIMLLVNHPVVFTFLFVAFVLWAIPATFFKLKDVVVGKDE